ncbi:MAG: TrkA family potassium uptake protein [Actinomycetota bacterium]
MTVQPMRIAIAGAGKVGRFVARDLRSKNHDVTVIEQSKKVVETHAGEFEANFVIGDACELATLDEAVLASCEVMVAATGDDEDNLVISLLAKQEFAVPRVIARVDESWGVDVAVSTPHLLTALVEEAVSVGDLVRLLSLEQGKVALVEITLAEDSPVVGKSLGDLGLPTDCTLVAIVRDRHVIAPTDETSLYSGDEILALASPEAEPELLTVLTTSR